MPPSPPNTAPSWQCRRCRKSYTADELPLRRACPQCRGPLISSQQAAAYVTNTLAALHRLKHLSSLTLASGALLAMTIQIVISTLKHSQDYKEITYIVISGGAASLVATGLWWHYGTQTCMLLASVVFQLTACIYAISAFIASAPLMELADNVPGKIGDYLKLLVVLTAISPLGLSLIAWHHYASFNTIKKRSANA
ncbi:MAG: hypothetical protein ACAI34_06895 [Verrucomicrobium sp.]|nr:hypothetical protein [Verrucomicrobium sp.]